MQLLINCFGPTIVLGWNLWLIHLFGPTLLFRHVRLWGDLDPSNAISPSPGSGWCGGVAWQMRKCFISAPPNDGLKGGKPVQIPIAKKVPQNSNRICPIDLRIQHTTPFILKANLNLRRYELRIRFFKRLMTIIARWLSKLPQNIIASWP